MSAHVLLNLFKGVGEKRSDLFAAHFISSWQWV